MRQLQLVATLYLYYRRYLDASEASIVIFLMHSLALTKKLTKKQKAEQGALLSCSLWQSMAKHGIRIKSDSHAIHFIFVKAIDYAFLAESPRPGFISALRGVLRITYY